MYQLTGATFCIFCLNEAMINDLLVCKSQRLSEEWLENAPGREHDLGNLLIHRKNVLTNVHFEGHIRGLTTPSYLEQLKYEKHCCINRCSAIYNWRSGEMRNKV